MKPARKGQGLNEDRVGDEPATHKLNLQPNPRIFQTRRPRSSPGVQWTNLRQLPFFNRYNLNSIKNILFEFLPQKIGPRSVTYESETMKLLA